MIGPPAARVPAWPRSAIAAATSGAASVAVSSAVSSAMSLRRGPARDGRPGHDDIGLTRPGAGPVPLPAPAGARQGLEEVALVETEFQPAVGTARPDREPVEPGSPRVLETLHRLGGEEDRTLGADDAVEVPQHGQVVGAVMEALVEHGGVKALRRARSRQHVGPLHGEAPRTVTARCDQAAEVLVHLDRGDVETGRHHVARDVAPARITELDHAAWRELGQAAEQVPAGGQVSSDHGQRAALVGERALAGQFEVEGRGFV